MRLFKPANGVKDIGVKIVSLRAGRIGIPGRVADLLIKKDNMLIKRLKLHFKLYYNEITAQKGVLRIY